MQRSREPRMNSRRQRQLDLEEVMSSPSSASPQSNGRAHDSGDDDDDDTVNNNNNNNGKDYSSSSDPLTERFKDLLENMSAKRGATREVALAEMHKLATEHVLLPQLDAALATVLDTLRRSLKRGTAVEARLAAELYGLVYVSAVVDNEERFQDAHEPLTEAVKFQKNPEARAAAVDALALCCYVASTDATSTVACMALFEDTFTKQGGFNADVAASALDAWTLLATTVSPATLEAAFERVVKTLARLMQSDNIDLRLAGGETLALLLETLRERETFDEGNLRHIVDILHELATDSNRHRAKKERSRQRAAFRDILRTVDDQMPPEETLKFKRDTVVLNSWPEMRRMEALRSALGEGLHVHFRSNATVRDMFGLPPPSLEDEAAVERLSSIEKRMLYSPNSEANKARTRWLNHERQSKQALILGGFDD